MCVFSVLEGREKLAGGEARDEHNHRIKSENTRRALKGREKISQLLAPLQGA